MAYQVLNLLLLRPGHSAPGVPSSGEPEVRPRRCRWCGCIRWVEYDRVSGVAAGVGLIFFPTVYNLAHYYNTKRWNLRKAAPHGLPNIRTLMS